jgi:hypothetical protein
MARSIALGTWEIEDDLLLGVRRMEFTVDDGEGAEEQIGGVSHDCGAARGNAAFGLVEQQAGEEVVNGDGGLELGETLGQEGREVGGIADSGRGAAVLGTEGGRRASDGQAAAAVAGTLLATSRRGWFRESGLVDEIGVSRLVVHFVPRKE